MEGMSHIFFLNASVLLVVIINVFLGLRILWLNPRKSTNILFSLTSLTTAVFISFFALGINSTDPESSKLFFNLSLSGILTAVFLLHLILISFLNYKWKNFVLFPIYIISILILASVIYFSEYYFIASDTDMFFLNNIETGDFFWVTPIFFIFVALLSLIFSVYNLIKSISENDEMKRDRLSYVVLGTLYAILFITPAFFLVDEISIYPIVFPLFALFTIPLGYGIFSKKPENIIFIIKWAFVYFVLVALVTFIILAIYQVNLWLMGNIEDFPAWFVPMAISLLIVSGGWYLWYKFREGDILKYELITVITHKFRTPLTRIKWSVESLKSSSSEEDIKEASKEIEYSAQKLIELTNMLAGASRAEGINYQYDFQMENLNNLVKEVYSSSKERMDEKDIKYSFTFDNTFSKAMIDKSKLSLALKIFFENSISYTPRGGKIDVRIERDGDYIVFSITDTGIGISEKEMPYMFSEFYRTPKAKLVDTEGMGIGLYMSKRIIERHGGRVWVVSPGPNFGSTFYMSLPRA